MPKKVKSKVSPKEAKAPKVKAKDATEVALLDANLKLAISALENRVIELEGDLRRVVDVLAKDAGGQYSVLLKDIVTKHQGPVAVNG